MPKCVVIQIVKALTVSFLEKNAPVVEQEAFLNSYLSCLGLVSRYKILLCWQRYGLSCVEILWIFLCENKTKSPSLNPAEKLLCSWPEHQGCILRCLVCMPFWIEHCGAEFKYWDMLISILVSICFCTEAVRKLLRPS